MSGEEEPAEEAQSRRGALVGLLVVALLIAAATFLTERIGASARLQDCVQSGRTGCAPVRP